MGCGGQLQLLLLIVIAINVLIAATVVVIGTVDLLALQTVLRNQPSDPEMVRNRCVLITC